jgi:hypothetical protein
VWAVDPEIPLASLRSLQQVVDRTVTSDLLRTAITVAFAALALVLSLVGIYGVTSYAVALRRRELAIRMALGARRRRVVGEVVRQAMRPAVVGLALGVAGSWEWWRRCAASSSRLKAHRSPVRCWRRCWSWWRWSRASSRRGASPGSSRSPRCARSRCIVAERRVS